ncbi:hypothetical protein T440DRAFT_194762 [Plenodomus tracheiphilus IPT5]|uniref:Uncharacterized protein n=1 Tax=Plenodomus tracheiphilus IPT5 TaxID=1408161 RepID=A0A6A7AWA0_9PLEO|nr:hypothetical protein T440DRAFT_194762 [Plenodomus tracheiphilus IPT5]
MLFFSRGTNYNRITAYFLTYACGISAQAPPAASQAHSTTKPSFLSAASTLEPPCALCTIFLTHHPANQHPESLVGSVYTVVQDERNSSAGLPIPIRRA